MLKEIYSIDVSSRGHSQSAKDVVTRRFRIFMDLIFEKKNYEKTKIQKSRNIFKIRLFQPFMAPKK